MKRFLGDHVEFFRQYRRRFQTTGAVAPSSRFLARALARPYERHEGACRVLEVGPPRPRARPVGRDARDRQELPEPPAARFEARTERAQAEGNSPRDRHPGPLVLRVVPAPGEPRGVADQLEVLGTATARFREDLQGHAFPLDRLASGLRTRAGSRG